MDDEILARVENRREVADRIEINFPIRKSPAEGGAGHKDGSTTEKRLFLTPRRPVVCARLLRRDGTCAIHRNQPSTGFVLPSDLLNRLVSAVDLLG